MTTSLQVILNYFNTILKIFINKRVIVTSHIVDLTTTV